MKSNNIKAAFDGQKIMVSVNECARLTGCSAHFVRQLVAEGKAPGFYVNGSGQKLKRFMINLPMFEETLNEMSRNG